jgi:integrase
MGDVIRKERGGRFLGWYIRYRDADGRRKQRASHQPTKAEARRYLIEIEARIARGLIGIPEPAPPPPTVAELAERFLTEYSRPRIKDLARYRMNARVALRRALPLVGPFRADEIKQTDLEKLRADLARRSAPASVKLTLNFLCTVFSWAVKNGIVERNPVCGIERPATRSSLEYLSREEVRSVLDLAEKRSADGSGARMLHAALTLALHTGLRKGELLGLRWQDLDLETKRLTVARSFGTAPKGGEARHLRLPDSVIPAIAAWRGLCPRTPGGLVFPVLRGTPRMADRGHMLGLPELLALAGCRPLAKPWHALRHTFASHFVMSGGNILSLQKILGHNDIKMTLVYAHLAPDFLGEEMNRVRF